MSQCLDPWFAIVVCLQQQQLLSSSSLDPYCLGMKFATRLKHVIDNAKQQLALGHLVSTRPPNFHGRPLTVKAETVVPEESWKGCSMDPHSMDLNTNYQVA
ncbi:hypothetical protein FG05_35426 [Fusarium graminearum]|nr:hypothetical protein FG05_35426 [Fusarium graminearum]